MRKPLPCVDCITFPICKSEYTPYGYKRKQTSICYLPYTLRNKCELFRKYFNNYLTSETFSYRYKLFINHFEDKTDE